MSSDESGSDRRVKDRVDLNRKVQLRFEKFQDFLTEIAGNISPGGMFVRSSDPHEPGELLEFECSLADGYPLVSGRGEVVWTRRKSRSADQPSGMGVRFLELNDKSEALIRRIIEKRIQDGDKTFELEDSLADAKVDGEQAAPSSSTEAPAEPAAPAAVAGPDPIALPVPPIAPAAAAVPVSAPARAPAVPRPPESASPESPRTPPAAPELPKPPVPSPTQPTPSDSPVVRQPPLPRSTPATASKLPSQPRAQPQTPAVPKPPAQTPKAPPSRERSGAGESMATGGQSTQPPIARAGSGTDPFGESAGTAAPRRRNRRLGTLRFLELVLFSVLAGAFMLLVFNQYWVRPRIEGLEGRLEELTGSSRVGGAPGFSRAGGDSPAQPEDGEPGAPAAATGADVGAEGGSGPESIVAAAETADADRPRPSPQEAVQGWARAWSEQRVDDYLGFYAEDFAPASGLSRAAWEERRRERLSAQGAIRVAVVSFQIEELTPNEARVMFTQSFQSNRYRDRVRKTLRLLWVDDRWKIAEEIVTRQLPW